MYRDGTAETLKSIQYGVKASKINAVAPGVYFYYSRVTAPASSFTITIGQTHAPSPNPDWKQLGIQQVQFYDANCASNRGHANVTIASNGTVTIAVTGATAGATYYLSVKYNPGILAGTLVNKQGGAYPTVNYTDSTYLNGTLLDTSVKSVPLVPRGSNGGLVQMNITP